MMFGFDSLPATGLGIVWAPPGEGISPGMQAHNRKGPFEERFSAFLIIYEAL
jgi:hypothetical protein